MWFTNQRGDKEFAGGQDDWAVAAKAAVSCPNFLADVEEECVADEAISCYNCRYRRWTVGSFACVM
jgi:hypothetical protein